MKVVDAKLLVWRPGFFGSCPVQLLQAKLTVELSELEGTNTVSFQVTDSCCKSQQTSLTKKCCYSSITSGNYFSSIVKKDLNGL